jgi:hypothetical protein
MKHFHTLFLFISLLASSALNAQCENVTLENLTNPGPYEIATLTEATEFETDLTMRVPQFTTQPMEQGPLQALQWFQALQHFLPV